MENTVLVRHGEVFLKKGNRAWFVKALERNLQRAVDLGLGRSRVRVRSFHGRYEASAAGPSLSEGELARAADLLASTFGVVSVSPAMRIPPDLDVIGQAAFDLAARELDSRLVAHFKVAASRADKRFPLTSPELASRVGARIHQELKLPARMTDPDLVVGIEVHAGAAYVHARTVRGPGGLPVGTGGHGVLLLSGGIDSPAAGWMMAKRGCRLTAVHFHSHPYTSRQSQEKVRELVERLVPWTGPMGLVQIPLARIQEYLRDSAPNDRLVLFYRRSMVRLACRLAALLHAGALVTGESLGQVASQTMENIRVVEEAADRLVLRPLVGLDKVEAVDLAKRIGTFEVSARPHDDCCSLFLPPHPETRGNVESIRRVEEGLERLAELEDEAFASREESWPGVPDDFARRR